MVDSTYWLDLGTPAAFVRGSADLVLGRAPSPAVPGRCGDRLVLPTASVAPDAKLTGGTVVGAGAVIGAGARVDGRLHGPENATVEPNAVITDSWSGGRGDRRPYGPGGRGDRRRGPGRRDNELRDGIRIWCGSTLPDASVRFSSDQ